MAINDPGTAEHMDTSYLWRANKRGHRAHIENSETGQAYCQAENCSGGKPFDGRGTEIPDGRRLCQNCADLAGRNEADYREPDVRVLMGERLAEVEPESFASTVAPEPERTDLTSSNDETKWKRKKQVRPARRSRGRKARRSEAKHPGPFNDDLPW